MRLARLAHPAGVLSEAVRAVSLTSSRPRAATTAAAMTTASQRDGAGGTATAMDYNAILDDEATSKADETDGLALPNLDRPTVWR
jgi:hypothetical protein